MSRLLLRPAPLLVLLLTGCARPEPDACDQLTDAASYLWEQQAEDGGWHSTTHGMLQGGQAWTPFVLHALLQVPEDVAPRPEGGVARALAFLRAHVNDDGVLGLADPVVLEYPNYATAYALRVFAAHSPPADSALVRRMATYLRGQQFTEQRGITPDDPAYGSWGFGETGLAPGTVGHLDLSHTRRVLQALDAAGAADSASDAAATRFLRLAQRHPTEDRPLPPGNVYAEPSLYDGGFYASPVVFGTNKAGTLDAADGTPLAFRSYATTTADGLLALLATRHTLGSEPVEAAAAWLRAHPAWAYPEGIPEGNPWREIVLFYHLAVRAEAYGLIGETGWSNDLTALLAEHQHPDGHVANPAGGANKEDDPLLATALVTEALVRACPADSQ